MGRYIHFFNVRKQEQVCQRQRLRGAQETGIRRTETNLFAEQMIQNFSLEFVGINIKSMISVNHACSREK